MPKFRLSFNSLDFDSSFDQNSLCIYLICSFIVKHAPVLSCVELDVQLSEATSTLSLMSEELRKEKEMKTKLMGQMIDRMKYDEVVMKMRDAQTKAHQLQHDVDFRAAETTKLLSRKYFLSISVYVSASVFVSLCLPLYLTVSLSPSLGPHPLDASDAVFS